MTAEEAIKAGDVAAAREALLAEVRKKPADPKLRIFLFQLFCVQGDWPRALNQLDVIKDLDDSALAMVHTYRGAVESEPLRAAIFAGEKTPSVFGKPEEWVALMVQALAADAAGNTQAAAELREKGFEAAPARSGTLNGEDFEWLADADPRTGPMLEAIINGRYYWLPLSAVAAMVIEEPTDLRDLVWIPAHLKLTNGGDVMALLHCRYPGSEKSEKSGIALARETDWPEGDFFTSFGLGQRELSTDQGVQPFLSARTIEFEGALEEALEASEGTSEAPAEEG